MPNWCATTLKIKGDVKVLNEKIGSVLDGTEGGLVEFLKHLKLSEAEISKIETRGYVSYYEGDDKEILLDIESAWTPMLKPIVLMAEKYAREAEILYVATEPGVGLYLSNSPEFVGKYHLDIFDERLDLGYEQDDCSPDELKEDLECILEKQDGLPRLIEESMDKFAIDINRYEFCEIDDL